jgi:hypothetical protein
VLVPLASLWLAFAPPESPDASQPTQPAASEPDLTEAKRLSDNGTVGGVSLTLGVVGVAVGIRQLVTAKRVDKHRASSASTAWTPTAALGRDGAYFGMSARF